MAFSLGSHRMDSSSCSFQKEMEYGDAERLGIKDISWPSSALLLVLLVVAADG